MLPHPTSIAPDNQTLLFKHLPEDLTVSDCTDFLSSLGAVRTSYFGNDGPLRNSALAEFPSTEHAWEVIKCVHQRTILGKRISVEFFLPSDSSSKYAVKVPMLTSEVARLPPAHHIPEKEPFTPKWDISLTIPEHMYYKYPSSSPSILTNIVRCMASCPAFYTQVLHLMNRLHLPPPFGDSELFPGTLTVVSEPPLPTTIESQPVKDPVNPMYDNPEAMDFSSSTESELPSDENESTAIETSQLVRKSRVRRKRLRVHSRDVTHRLTVAPVTKPINTGKHSSATVSDLFETGPTVQSKLQLHVPSELPSTNSPDKVAQSRDSEGGFGVMRPLHRVPSNSSREQTHQEPGNCFQLRKRPGSSSDDSDNALTPSHHVTESNGSGSSQPSLSLNELRIRRLTPEERKNYAVFAKNYEPGDPTSRLYIKNLSPLVVEEDLYRVYGVFQFGLVKDLDFRPFAPTTSTDRLTIRLLTCGRMKGQAFVSLDSDQTAIQALEATNGLLLHDRPMVVQFARGAKGKIDANSLIE